MAAGYRGDGWSEEEQAWLLALYRSRLQAAHIPAERWVAELAHQLAHLQCEPLAQEGAGGLMARNMERLCRLLPGSVAAFEVLIRLLKDWAADQAAGVRPAAN